MISSILRQSILRIWFIAILLGIGFVSCAHEEPEFSGVTDESEEIFWDLNLSTKKSASRAMTEEAETAFDVHGIRVLVFAVPENGVETLAYVAPYVVRSSSAVTLKLRRSVDGEKYRVVVVANHSEGPTLTQLESAIGKSYAEVAELFYFDVDGAWDTSQSCIPMWGGFAPVVIAPGEKFPETLQLLRSVARADIGIGVDENGIPVSGADASLSNFRLTTVRLFGSKKRGWIMPRLEAFSASDVTDGMLGEVTAPSVWIDDFPSNEVGADGYIVSGNIGGIDYPVSEGARNLFQEIYLAESATSPTTSACLIIGGRYNADPLTTAWEDVEPTYYRIDFCRPDNGSLAPVLRNHRYLLNVVQVLGPGLPTIEEALKAVSLNIKVETKAWNDFTLTDTDELVSLHLKFDDMGFTSDVTYLGDGHPTFLTQADDTYYLAPDNGDGYDEERVIRAIAVAAFRENGSGDYVFDELLTFDRFEENDLYVKIHRRPYKRRLVAIANFNMGKAAAWIESEFKKNPLSGLSNAFRGSVLKPSGITFLPWDGLPASGVSREIDSEEIREGKLLSININMLVSAARLDVGINYTDPAATSGAGQTDGDYPFYLRAVGVASYQAAFSLFPSMASTSSLDDIVAGKVKVPAPISDFKEPSVDGMLLYPHVYPSGVNVEHLVMRKIYLPETATGSETTLIIKGGPDPQDSSNDTYYKVVLNRGLLRNHRYVLNLSNITAPGAVTPEAALNATPLKVEATVLTWDNLFVDLPNVGQYTLKVTNVNLIAIHECKLTDTIHVYTTYPNWQILDSKGAVLKTYTGNQSSIKLSDAGVKSAGTYVICAGNLRWELKVTK